jgi:hypothetical protein
MTEKSITVRRTTVDLMAADNQSEIKAMAYKIYKFGGIKSQEEAVSMAIYSWMTDLNYFNNECYWYPGVGPSPGVQGYRRKAKEYNLRVGGDKDWDYSVRFEVASITDANYDPDKGDIAWKAILTDTKARKRWEDTYAKFFNMAIEAGRGLPRSQ